MRLERSWNACEGCEMMCLHNTWGPSENQSQGSTRTSHCTSGHYTCRRKKRTHIGICLTVFPEVLLTAAKKKEQVGEWVDKLGLHIKRYCLSKRKNGILIHTTVCVGLRKIMLRKTR